MWNDTDVPLAYLITFRCRGTWLHGDERGAIDRHHNVYGSPRIEQNQVWKTYNEQLLKGDPAYLFAARRRSVKQAIRETCHRRGWYLHAVNIRTNHAHSVVAAAAKKPSFVLHALKANATRQMREDGNWAFEYSPWVDKVLWNELHIARAVEYVLYGQGDDLPDFD